METIQIIIAVAGLLLSAVGYLGGRFHAARKAGADQALSAAAIARLNEYIQRVDQTVYRPDRSLNLVTREDCDRSKRDYRERICSKLDEIKRDQSAQHHETKHDQIARHDEISDALKRILDWQLDTEGRLGVLEGRGRVTP